MDILLKRENYSSDEEYQKSLETLKKNIEIHSELHQEVELSKEDDLALLNLCSEDD